MSRLPSSTRPSHNSSQDNGRSAPKAGRPFFPIGLSIDNAPAPNLVEHSDASEILFGSTLDGLPLDALSHIREQRSELDKARDRDDRLPIHNHGDPLRFPSPIAPLLDEVRKTADGLKLFLRGVISGRLSRTSGHSGRYVLKYTSQGATDTVSIGSERTVRRVGFTPRHQTTLEAQLAAFESALEPIQLLALATLFEWTGMHAYAPRSFEARGLSDRISGLTSAAAMNLARHYEERFHAAIDMQVREARANGGEPPRPVRQHVLRERIAEWTFEIADSISDVDPSEVDMEAGSPQGVKAKRRIDFEAFQPAALRALGA